MPTKPFEKKDMVVQIANCFSQTNLPNITLANKYSEFMACWSSGL